MTTQFSVVLNGVFAIFETDAGLDVYVPDMGDSHAYRTGQWLAEVTIPRGRHSLTGVVAGSGKFKNSDPHFFLPGTNPAFGAQAYAALHFPTPSTIEAGVIATIEPRDFSPPLNQGSLITVYRLTYENLTTGNLADVRLGNVPWTGAEADPAAPALQIICDAELEVGAQLPPSHPVETFNTMLGMFDNPGRARINASDGKVTGGTLKCDLQSCGLCQRRQLLNKVGIEILGGHPPGSFPLVRPPVHVIDQPACGGIGVSPTKGAKRHGSV